jgi:hypothetical protein
MHFYNYCKNENIPTFVASQIHFYAFRLLLRYYMTVPFIMYYTSRNLSLYRDEEISDGEGDPEFSDLLESLSKRR